jgi:hypothetical protein
VCSKGSCGSVATRNAAIGGGVAACAAVSLLFVAIGVFACRKRRRDAQGENSVPLQSLPVPEASSTASAGVYGDVTDVQRPDSAGVGVYGAAPLAVQHEYDSISSPLTLSVPSPSAVSSSYAQVSLPRQQNVYDAIDSPLD